MKGDPRINRVKSRTFPLVLLLCAPMSAHAHHSTAAYDATKPTKLSGTVKETQWTNPHSWIQILVPNSQGATTEWAIEFGNPVINLRHGWQRDSVKAGDKVSMVIYPARDGSAHGTLQTIHMADGRTLDGAAAFVGKDIAAGAAAAGAPPK